MKKVSFISFYQTSFCAEKENREKLNTFNSTKHGSFGDRLQLYALDINVCLPIELFHLTCLKIN